MYELHINSTTSDRRLRVGKRHKKTLKTVHALGADSLTSYVRKYEKLAVRRRLN